MEFEINIDELRVEVWRFTLINKTLFLDLYSLRERASKRHRKYKAVKNYNRLSQRESSIKESEVPFTYEIRTRALELYFKSIDCKLWSEK